MSSRIPARLEHLSREDLITLIDDLAFTIPEAMDMTENFLHEKLPFPEWARDSVLRHVDLLAMVMQTLGAKDCAAKQVCKEWQTRWTATQLPRRILHQTR